SLSPVSQFIQLTQTVQSGEELDGTAAPTITSNYTYDGYGNVTGRSVTSGDGYSLGTVNIFNPADTAHWFIQELATSTVTSTVPPNLTPWGSAVSTPRTTGYSYDPNAGLVSQQTGEPGSGTLQVQTPYTRDAFGNIPGTSKTASNAANRSTTTYYD